MQAQKERVSGIVSNRFIEEDRFLFTLDKMILNM